MLTCDEVYNHGKLYDKQGDIVEAERTFQWALDGYKKATCEENPKALQIAKSLQSVQRWSRRQRVDGSMDSSTDPYETWRSLSNWYFMPPINIRRSRIRALLILYVSFNKYVRKKCNRQKIAIAIAIATRKTMVKATLHAFQNATPASSGRNVQDLGENRFCSWWWNVGCWVDVPHSESGNIVGRELGGRVVKESKRQQMRLGCWTRSLINFWGSRHFS